MPALTLKPFQAVVLLIVAMLFVGCTTTIDNKTETAIELDADGRMRLRSESRSGAARMYTDTIVLPTITRDFPKNIKTLRKINSLVIGVSNFENGIVPSPQHAIGASIVESLLKSMKEQPQGVGVQVNFVADLRMDVDDPGWAAAEVSDYLKRIGQWRVYEYSKIYTHNPGELWPILQGNKITKNLLIDEIRRHAKSLKAGEFGIFYLATHGILGEDNIRYALASDSDKSRKETMLSYDEVVKIYHEEIGEEAAHVLVIFDACLAREDETFPENVFPLRVPSSVLVMSAAAPGHYSLYWSQKAGHTLVSSILRIGPFRREFTARDATYLRTISAVPVAFARALRYIELACETDAQSLPSEITAREFGQLLAESVELLASNSKSDVLPKTQNAMYIESETLTALDDYYEMALSPSQKMARRQRSAIFSTGCER